MVKDWRRPESEMLPNWGSSCEKTWRFTPCFFFSLVLCVFHNYKAPESLIFPLAAVGWLFFRVRKYKSCCNAVYPFSRWYCIYIYVSVSCGGPIDGRTRHNIFFLVSLTKCGDRCVWMIAWLSTTENPHTWITLITWYCGVLENIWVRNISIRNFWQW